MKIAVDISLYPFDPDFVPPISDVIERLNAHDNLEIWTNAMSTQIVGEFEDVWNALGQEIVVMAIGYLLLAIRENIWCWFFAGVSTALYVWLFFGARLYMESALNAFYFGMAVYGWYVWRSGRTDQHRRPVAAGGVPAVHRGTFLVARKVLENWWYWLAIDGASVFIYWSRDLDQTAALFVLYLVMIPFGIVSWTRSYREAQQW